MVFPSIVQLIFLGKIIVRATKREWSEELPILWFVHVSHSLCVEMMCEEKPGKIKEESWDQVREASNAVPSVCGLPASRLLWSWFHLTLGIAAPRVKQTALKDKDGIGGTRTIWPLPTNLHIQNLEVGGGAVPHCPSFSSSRLQFSPSVSIYSSMAVLSILFYIFFPLTESFLNY